MVSFEVWLYHVVLPSGKLLVTGGCSDIYSVDIATIKV